MTRRLSHLISALSLMIFCPGSHAMELRLPALADLESTFTLQAERVRFLVEKRTDLVEQVFSQPLTPERAEKWPGAFWAAGLMQERTPLVRGAIGECLARWDAIGNGLRRQALEALATLFPGEFRAELEALLPRIDNPKLFAMAGYLSMEGGTEPATVGAVLERAFTEWKEDPILEALGHRLQIDRAAEVKSRPGLETLLSADFLPGRAVLFSLQRTDRRHPGLAVVRLPSGALLRDDSGAVFRIPHLGLALSNMPGTITNGNAPVGLFSIKGTGVSRNVFIGPTPFLWSRLPIEAEYGDFLHGAGEGGEWTEERYLALFPESWRGYWPIREAWLAGRAGRGEIICHGTTIDPEFYADAGYYPQTPSLGCLCALELWSPETGQAIRSDQLSLVEAWKRAAPSGNGFLLVLELDDEARPVELRDVIPAGE